MTSFAIEDPPNVGDTKDRLSTKTCGGSSTAKLVIRCAGFALRGLCGFGLNELLGYGPVDRDHNSLNCIHQLQESMLLRIIQQKGLNFFELALAENSHIYRVTRESALSNV